MSGSEAYMLSVIQGRRGVVPTLLRALLSLLAGLYAVGLELYLWMYRAGIRRQGRLVRPVICVGNLTTGGTGKTPMTQMVCRILMAQGRRVAVLNRGYGGANEYGCAVVSDGEQVLLSAAQAGDEACLLAHSLPGVPVVVGKERRTTGALACERFAPDVVVMDDGMQFWQLHKDVIICLLNACEPFDNGWVLPRGLLREPISHLRRAQMVVLTNSRRAGSERVRALRERVLQIAPNVSVFVGDLQARSLRSLDSTVRYEVDWLAKRRVFTFAALGNPTSFEHTVKELGAEIVERVQLADHQAFSRERLAEISDRAATLDIDALITTEKDAIKLPMVEMATPVFVLEVEMVLEESEAFWGALEGRLCGTLLGDDNSDS